MKRYFLETSVIVNFLRNRNGAVELIESLEGELATSYISLAELYEGISRVKNPKELEKGVLNFFTGMNEVYGLDVETAKHFGQTRALLKQKGDVIEDLDILLGATCLTHNLTMITYNQKHFERIPNLDIYPLFYIPI